MTPENREERLNKAIVSKDIFLADTLETLDRSGLGVLLVCEEGRRLVGIITDGDIRRALLKGISFKQACYEIAVKDPLVAPKGVSRSEALRLMNEGKGNAVNQLPVVDDEGRVINLYLRRDFVPDKPLDIPAVLMVGGFGTRLRPLTDDLPKPMLPVGDRPLLEHIVERLRDSGIHKINMTTHFMPEKISKHFGNGEDFGVEITYVSEDKPLGTAGALGLLEEPNGPVLVMNGDILTRVDFRAMYEFHQEHEAAMTVGVRQYVLQVPYGVVECSGAVVTQIKEKPEYRLFVNAGIYLLDTSAHQFIPAGQRFDMTDLIERLVQEGYPVVSFPIVEYWLDIGEHPEYKQAQEDVNREGYSA